MKNFIKILFLAVIFPAYLISCEDNQLYDGPLRTKFQGTSSTFFVQDIANSTTDVIVQLIGNPQDRDLTLNIVADASSTAKAGVDYTMPATVTVPAGSNLGTFSIKGFFAGLTDPKKLVLNLQGGDGVTPTTTLTTYTVNMRQYCAWTLGDFVGTWTVNDVSGYSGAAPPYEIEIRLGTESGTLLVDGLWGEDIPVKVVPTEPTIGTFVFTIPKQAYFIDPDYGQAWIEQRSAGTFDPCEWTVSTNYKVFVDAGYFDQVTSSKWTKNLSGI